MEYNNREECLPSFLSGTGCVRGSWGWLSSNLLGIYSEWWEAVLLGGQEVERHSYVEGLRNPQKWDCVFVYCLLFQF